ncbi:hypothetical protein MST22_05145 [Virgibacillus halodenitrificans]|uniref:hypothetical protein n=1 Tax=Virgibacillus halodenitrificans TaxID=1482 RepID=UPI001FB2BDD0|nr:hypothetical protein [Virgibacillus halodenitrificans]
MGFVSNHQARDSELPNYRKKILSSIETDLLNDDNVMALFYGGSIGNENTDEYSDIDLRVVVKPEKIKEYVVNKRNRAQEWGNVLYFEEVNPLSVYTVAHYDCFIKVDAFYYIPSDIHPSLWLQNIKIIKDTDKMMAKILDNSMLLTYELSLDGLELWRTKFFAHFHEAYRRVMRKEYFYAMKCIDNLRLSMIAGWYMEIGVQPNTFGDWARYEGEKSNLEEWQQSLLKSCDCRREPVEILNVMKRIAHEFKKVHHSLCYKLNIDENPEWLAKIINMVI